MRENHVYCIVCTLCLCTWCYGRCSLELQRKREERTKEEEERKAREVSRLRRDLASETTPGVEHKRKGPMQEVVPLGGGMEYKEEDEEDDEDEE